MALAGLRVTAKTPVPESDTVCGLLVALSLTLRLPVRFPVVAGVNVTLMVHLDLLGKLVAQVVAETAKSPVAEITILVRATVWLLDRVNVFAALVVPTTWVA